MKFETWFKAQFGPRRDKLDFKKVDDKGLRSIIHRGICAEAELERRKYWDAEHNAALKGWVGRAANP